MGKLGYSAAHGIVVRTFHNLIELRQAQTAHHLFVRLWCRYKASIVLDSNLAFVSRRLCLCLTWHNTLTVLPHETRSVTEYCGLHVLDLFATQTRQLHRVLHSQQSIEAGSHNVVWVGRPQHLCAHIAHTHRLHHGTHRASRDYSRTF